MPALNAKATFKSVSSSRVSDGLDISAQVRVSLLTQDFASGILRSPNEQCLLGEGSSWGTNLKNISTRENDCLFEL